MPTSSAPKPQVAVSDPADGDIYVSNAGNGTVSVISSSTNMVVAVLRVGNLSSSPLPPVFDSSNGKLYAAISSGDTVAVISGETLVSTVRMVAPFNAFL